MLTQQTSPRSGSRRVISRRDFLIRTGAATATAPFALPNILRARNLNSRLQHASIGVGGMMGNNDLQNFLKHDRTQVVALCDVDANHLRQAQKAVPDARAYRDWRELLETEGDRIDSVNVTVPDHMHYAIARSAIDRGKHVYCQKPMCHDVAEVRALTEAAKREGVVTQLGTQLAATAGDRTAVRWLREGRVGKVKRVYLCSNRPSAGKYRLTGPRPKKTAKPPAHLDWNLWLGTAPERPYAPDIYHPIMWRSWLDFGTGWSGDIGCHVFDAVWKGLEMTAPSTVRAEVQASWRNSPARRADTWPQSNHITWTFPGNKYTEGDKFIVEWADGEFHPPLAVRKLYGVEDYPAESAMIMGTEGSLLTWLGGTPQLLPEEKFAHVERPRFKPRNHYHHFADACLGREMCESHFAQTGPMTEAILLGTVAIRVPDTELRWNTEKLTIPNNATANALLRRNYREGWDIPLM